MRYADHLEIRTPQPDILALQCTGRPMLLQDRHRPLLLYPFGSWLKLESLQMISTLMVDVQGLVASRSGDS